MADKSKSTANWRTAAWPQIAAFLDAEGRASLQGRNRPIVNAGSGLEEVNCEDPNAEALTDPLGSQPGAE